MLGNSISSTKQNVIEKADNGNKEAIALIEQAKYWHTIKKEYLKQNER
jgi:hypothetical protein